MKPSHQQFTTMLQLQATMNAKINPDWMKAGNNYLRAIVVEGAEGIEHHGWKWWKAQTPDMEQLRLELVDIWHFLLSELLVRHHGDYKVISNILVAKTLFKKKLILNFDGNEFHVEKMTVVEKIELLIGLSVSRRISIPLFSSIMHDCNLSWADLIETYVAKNTLNIFRQNNGYKDGTYRKIWDGREDNVHLLEILSECDSSHPNFMDQLYGGLQQRYASIAV